MNLPQTGTYLLGSMEGSVLEYALIDGILVCRVAERGGLWMYSTHSPHTLLGETTKEKWLMTVLEALPPPTPVDHAQENAAMRGQLEAITKVLKLEEVRRILEATEARGNE